VTWFQNYFLGTIIDSGLIRLWVVRPEFFYL
jgi:hypothetical protein